MPNFNYTAVDARGAEKSGVLEAWDERQLTALLRQQGLFATEIEAVALNGPKGRTKTGDAVSGKAIPGEDELRKEKFAPRRILSQGVRPRELAVFTRQLATLLRAGMPLLRGLETLGRQERKGSLRRVLDGLAEVIRSGGTLSEGMVRHPRTFDRLYINMVKAGEAGGVTDVVLDRLARFQEKSLQLKGKIGAALVYPLIVMGVAVVIVAGLMILVVPKFKQIFADMLKGAPLPPLTQLVLTLSEMVRSHFLLVAGTGLIFWAGVAVFARTATGSLCLDHILIRLPFFGELFLKGIIGRFSRTLGTLLASGVPILPALVITRDTCGNGVVAGAITIVHDRVKEGASVARPLEETKAFPPMVTSMIDVGEHTGQMAEMLGKVADIYEDEVDNAVAGLSSLIEPIMILFLALVVGTIVIALFLPIIRIVQLLT